ncbi:MAG TPA: hypothetical protein VN733_09300 [Solirubrobacterales bacterium]|nr:hypothetical protein [Solirubrobacterales bacterium]
MSRFRFLALFATLAVLATVFASCGGGGEETSAGSNEDPQQLLESASLEGVKSGSLDLALHVRAEGDEGGDVDVDLSGPFEAGSKEDLPQLQVSAEASGTAGGEDLDFDGGLTLLTDRAFVAFEGTDYEVDPTTFGFLKAAFERSQQQSGEEDITACQEAAEGIRFSQFADNLENEGSADVDGTATTKVSGDLNVDGAIDAVIKLTEDPACSSQLEAAGPLPVGELEEAKGELSKAIEKAHVDLYVGDDDIVRKVDAELTIAPPDAADEKVELDFELTLSGVNEEQSFSAPSDAKPLEDLFQKLGVNPLELLEQGQSGGLGGLLEGITGGSSGGSGGNARTECLQNAQTTADLQECANLRE